MGYGAVNAPTTAPSAAVVAAAVWNALMATHNTVLTFGNKYQNTNVDLTEGVITTFQTQFAEDSARFTLAGFATLEIQPAVGEFDNITFTLDDAEIGRDSYWALYDGTNLSLEINIRDSMGPHRGNGITSTNTIRVRFRNSESTNTTYLRAIITRSEEV